MSAKQIERARKRARERRVIQVRVALVVITIAAVWGAWTALSASHLFEIKRVEVTGVERLSASEVTTRAALPDGATLLRFDRDGVEARLLKDPWIASVRLSRRIPSTLAIRIRERVPVALVDTGVTFWFVDRDGRVLSESVPDTGTALPVIRDLPDFVAEPGVKSTSKTLRNSLEVLSGISSDLRASVRSVSAPTVSETSLLTSKSVEIMIGEASRLDEKSVLVADILREQGDSVVFIDVRSVERPISRGLN